MPEEKDPPVALPGKLKRRFSRFTRKDAFAPDTGAPLESDPGSPGDLSVTPAIADAKTSEDFYEINLPKPGRLQPSRDQKVGGKEGFLEKWRNSFEDWQTRSRARAETPSMPRWLRPVARNLPRIVAGLAIAALIAVIAIVANVLRDESRSQLAQLEVAPGTSLPAAHTQAALELETLQSTINGFFHATTVDELAKHVRHPGETLPRLERYYAQSPPQPRAVEIDPSIIVSDPKGDQPGFMFVQVTLDDVAYRSIAVERSSDGPRIDWECFVAYSETSWADFLETKPREPSPFRVRAIENDYYNFEFADRARYRCFRLTDLPDADYCYGYVERGTPAEAKLLSLFKNAKAGPPLRPCILALKWPAPPKGEASPRDRQVLITDFVRNSWLVP